MGSKRAHSTCLCTPNSVKVYLVKHIFDPFLTDFLSQNIPFSRHFVTVPWPKWLAMGSKWAYFIRLCTPNGLRSFLEEHIFNAFLTHFGRKRTHFQCILWLLRGSKGLQWAQKWAHFTCLGTPNGLGPFLEKHIFDPFLTRFLSQKSPFSTPFGILRGPKQATTSSKSAKNTCFGIPCGPRSFLKSHFLQPC